MTGVTCWILQSASTFITRCDTYVNDKAERRRMIPCIVEKKVSDMFEKQHIFYADP